MTEIAHTPLPWHETNGDVWIETQECHSTIVCCQEPLRSGECCGNGLQGEEWEQGQELLFRTTPENAALIVKAVNCHDELVEALSMMYTYSSPAIELGSAEGHDAALRKTKAALAKAGAA